MAERDRLQLRQPVAAGAGQRNRYVVVEERGGKAKLIWTVEMQKDHERRQMGVYWFAAERQDGDSRWISSRFQPSQIAGTTQEYL
jgi:hypothetical protein